MQQVELAAVQHLLKYLFQRKKCYNYGSYQGGRGGPCRMLKIWPIGTRMNSVSDTIHYLWIMIHNNIWLSYVTAWSVNLEEKNLFLLFNILCCVLVIYTQYHLSTRYIFIYLCYVFKNLSVRCTYSMYTCIFVGIVQIAWNGKYLLSLSEVAIRSVKIAEYRLN